jgi:hypothetical protein
MRALEQIDEDKKGLVRLRVLINLLECMDFKLASSDMDRIREDFTTPIVVTSHTIGGAHSNQTTVAKKPQAQVRYRDVLNSLHYSMDSRCWVLRALDNGSLERKQPSDTYSTLKKNYEASTVSKRKTQLEIDYN